MSAVYRNARLKIKRAEKHICDVNAALDALEKACVVTIEERPDGGLSMSHAVPDYQKALDDLSLIVGDALHNLRTALDFAWYETISRCLPDRVSSNTRFPVRETREAVEAALHGIEVDTRCKPLFDCIMDKIQPYDGGHNRAVWTLHQLDISDKHILLLGLDPYGHVRGITIRDANGEVSRGSSMPTKGIDGWYIIDFNPGEQIEEQGKLSVKVTLQEAGIYKPVPVDSLLADFIKLTSYFVQLLENL